MNIGSAFKGKYLKHSDLGGKRVMVTMAAVVVETVGQGKEQENKPVLYFKGHERGLVLNKTNAYAISSIVGSDETDTWAGHRIVLHEDRTLFGGKMVDCIRVAPVPAGKGTPPPPPPVEEEISDSFEGGEEEESPF